METLNNELSGIQANDYCREWVHFSEVILTYLNNKINQFLFAVESESVSGSVCSKSFHCISQSLKQLEYRFYSECCIYIILCFQMSCVERGSGMIAGRDWWITGRS